MSSPSLPDLDLLTGLNPAQRQAVVHANGPLLVVAGAGSGKTRVLTHRIAYLLQQGEDPFRMLAVTFTNKAAGEMRERLAKLTGLPAGQLPLVATFHAFCVRFLRAEIEIEGYSRSFTIYDADDQLSAVKAALKTRSLPGERIKPQAVRSLISTWKNSALSPVQAREQAEGMMEEWAADAYSAYQEELKKAEALDFDDLLIVALRILKSHPDVLARYQERFRQVLVDEYQDTNRVQYEMISLLANKYRNLLVVGDDWQSIYGWRGADIRNILDFERDFPDAAVVKLEQNYRSTQHILDAADGVIKQNAIQKDKVLFTQEGDGEPVRVVEARDAYDEARVIATDLMRFRQEHSLDEAAVLYRTNAQSRILERVLLERNIPYRIVGGVRFYDRKEVKDVLGYLRLLVNPQDAASLTRIINEPRRGIGEKSKDALVTWARAQGKDLLTAASAARDTDAFSSAVGAKLAAFGDLFKELKGKAEELPPSELIQAVAEKTGLRDMLKDGTDEGDARYGNVLELAGAAKRFDDEGPEGLMLFLEEVALIADLDKTAEEGEAVTLMTMHNAKGLEYHTVYVVGCEEGIFPHTRTLERRSELEEETRLCYVAMTRAKRRLFLICCQERELYGSVLNHPPSRFLSFIPAQAHERITSDTLYSGAPRFGRTQGTSGTHGWNRRTGGTPFRSYGDGVDESYEEQASDMAENEAAPAWEEPSTDTAVETVGDGVSGYKNGQNVLHPLFGKGIVVASRTGTLVVAFPKYGLKRLDPAHVTLKVIA